MTQVYGLTAFLMFCYRMVEMHLHVTISARGKRDGRMHMKYRFIQLALIGAAISVASAAHAQTGAPTLRVACGTDMQKLCPGLKGKDARMCLRAYHAQISPDCMAFLEQAKGQRASGAMTAPAPAAGSPPSAPPTDKQ